MEAYKCASHYLIVISPTYTELSGTYKTYIKNQALRAWAGISIQEQIKHIGQKIIILIWLAWRGVSKQVREDPTINIGVVGHSEHVRVDPYINIGVIGIIEHVRVDPPINIGVPGISEHVRVEPPINNGVSGIGEHVRVDPCIDIGVIGII